MFNWIKSPTLPDTIEAQAFRSISSENSPILRINTINDRTNRMKLVPWEDILEIYPDAIYLRDANGIVMPARDHNQKRISPKSIKLQADVVLEVVSTHDIPPTSTRPENILKTEELEPASSATTTTGITGAGSGAAPRSSMTRGSADLDTLRHSSSSRSRSRSSSSSAKASSESAHTHTPKISSESARKNSQEITPTAVTVGTATTNTNNNTIADGDDEDDWSPFQANSTASFGGPPSLTIPGAAVHDHAHTHITSGAGGLQLDQHGIPTSNNTLLRQEMIHRLELLSAEQEERLDIILKACRARPPR